MGGNQELIICLLIGARTHTEPPRHTFLQPASPHAGTHSSGHRTQQHSKDGQESLLPGPEDCVIPEPDRGCRKVLSTGTGTQNTPRWERVSQALEGKQMGLLGGGGYKTDL